VSPRLAARNPSLGELLALFDAVRGGSVREQAMALALQPRDLPEKIAGNVARRTVHPREDLLKLAMIGLIKAARRHDP
jgi:DNA-directed RNA polymerase specialized sigma subunit